jgi:hypothetical protein
MAKRAAYEGLIMAATGLEGFFRQLVGIFLSEAEEAMPSMPASSPEATRMSWRAGPRVRTS